MLSQLASQLRERLLSWSSWSGRRGDAGRQEGPRRPCLVCLLLTSPTRDPGSASLAHTSSPTPSACPPGPSCAIPLQGGVPALRGAYLPGVPPFPFLWAPKCPREPPPEGTCSGSTQESGREAPSPSPGILEMAPGSISFHYGRLPQLPCHLLTQDRYWGGWAGNRLPGMLSARQKELLLGFLRVVSSYPLSHSGL